MAKPVYEIDGEDFETLEGFYDTVTEVLLAGSEWGRNLDAFNDILRGGFGTPEGGFVFRWKNSAASRQRLGYRETERQLQQRLALCHRSHRDGVLKDIEKARKGVGQTLFDVLVEIIEVHGPDGDESEDGVELILA